MAKRKKRIISLAVCALALAAGLTVKPAMAYFTDYTEAGGTVSIAIEDTYTGMYEDVSDMTKHITIRNNGNVDCFIRVAAIAPEGYTLTLANSESESESGWSYSDGYYYYSNPVPVNGETDALNIAISGYDQVTADGSALPEEFNVIIIQESAKVLYKEDGTAYADWSQKFTTDTDEQTFEQEEAESADGEEQPENENSQEGGE